MAAHQRNKADYALHVCIIVSRDVRSRFPFNVSQSESNEQACWHRRRMKTRVCYAR